MSNVNRQNQYQKKLLGGKKSSEGTLLGFPGDSVVKNPPANAGDARDAGLIPGLGRSPGAWHGTVFWHSCLKIPLGRGAWKA